MKRKMESEIVSVSVFSKVSLEYTREQEKHREKEKVGGRPAKLNEKKGNRDLERETKKTKKTFFCWKNNIKIL